MIRAVFDTHVLAAGAVVPARAAPARLIDAVEHGRVELAVCDPILIELRRTLARPYDAARLRPTTAAAYLRTLVTRWSVQTAVINSASQQLPYRHPHMPLQITYVPPVIRPDSGRP